MIIPHGEWKFSLKSRIFIWTMARFQFLPPQKFSECIVSGCICFLVMFACVLSLEWLSGSQPNFNTRWRGGMARILWASFPAWFTAILEKIVFSLDYGSLSMNIKQLCVCCLVHSILHFSHNLKYFTLPRLVCMALVALPFVYYVQTV